jgi:hypothetical protein
MYRNWKEEVLVDSNTLPFQEWVKEAVRQMPLQTSNVEEWICVCCAEDPRSGQLDIQE